MRRCVQALGVVAGLVAGPVNAADQDQAGTFSIHLGPLQIGGMVYALRQSGGRYAASATIESAGVVAALRKARFSGRSNGTLRKGQPRPARYEGYANTGRHEADVALDYTGGVPRLLRYTSDRPTGPDSPDPSSQGGTLDPMTAMFSVFRQVPEADACNRRIDAFDGKRRSRVTLGPPARNGEVLVCQGEYRRVAGFPVEDMADRVRFPFTLEFEPVRDGYVHVVRGEIQTIYGTARIVRR